MDPVGNVGRKGIHAPGGSAASPGLLAPEHPAPPPPLQQHPPGELPRAMAVPAVDALTVAEHALPAAVARAVPAVPGLPHLGHAMLHGISRPPGPRGLISS